MPFLAHIPYGSLAFVHPAPARPLSWMPLCTLDPHPDLFVSRCMDVHPWFFHTTQGPPDEQPKRKHEALASTATLYHVPMHVRRTLAAASVRSSVRVGWMGSGGLGTVGGCKAWDAAVLCYSVGREFISKRGANRLRISAQCAPVQNGVLRTMENSRQLTATNPYRVSDCTGR